MTPRPHVAPPVWTPGQLESDRQRAIEDFRRQRMEEPLELYLQTFDERQAVFRDLLAVTADLTRIADHAIAILTNERLCEALRYVSGPPISLDDLKTVAEVTSLSAQQLRADPAIVQRLVDTVLLGLDRRRFPWVKEDRAPSDAERASAILASAALIASQRAGTARRNESRAEQERRIEDQLLARGFEKVATRVVRTMADAPAPGQFCRESMLGERKADVLVGLWDNRLMPIEAKVSNSATNSIKRLKNDAAVKAEVWRADFGERHVVPSAVLSGVYARAHLENAQHRGLTLFWGHSLERVTDWIESTR